MAQPIKKSITNPPKPHKKQTTRAARIKKIRERAKKNHEYGTSKLEERFARDFLDKLGVEYVYQYKMESIGRYLDFFLPQFRVAVEVDGDYYHSYGLLYEQMSPMQKKNKRVDEQKNHWCLINGIPLVRIWEHDINKHPQKVLTMLKDLLHLYQDKKRLDDDKKRRH